MRKRLKSFVAALLIAALIIPQGIGIQNAHAAEPMPGDTIISHGFESDDKQGWGNRGAAQTSITKETSRTGNGALLTTGRTAGWHGPSLNVTSLLQPGVTYEISGYVKLAASQPASDLKFSVEQTGLTGSDQYKQVNNPAAVTDTEWVELKGNYTYNSYATGLTLYLESSDATSQFVLDDFTIKLITPPPQPQEPAPDYPKVIAEHGFENNNYHNWTVRGGAGQVMLTDEAAHTGTHSLKMTGRSQDWHMARVEMTGLLEKGASYEVELYARLADGESSTPMHLALTETKNGSNTETDISTPAEVASNGWTKLSGQFTYSADAANGYLYVYAKQAPAAVYLIDDVKLTITAPGQVVVEPSTFVYDFEDNTTQGWSGRNGTEIVEPSLEAANSGQYSLKTTNRIVEWHGPNVDVTGKIAKGASYEISAYVKFVDAPATPSSVKLSMEVDVNGAKSWTTIASAPIGHTDWFQLKGNFTLNTDATLLGLYIESEKATDAYYIDDVGIESLAPPAEGLPIQTDIPKLREVYENYFTIGAAVEAYQLSGKHKEMLDYHYNALVAENAMKPAYLQPNPGNYQWATADQLINFAHDNNMYFRFHTLVWHSQAAEWMFQDEQGNYLDPTPENKELVLARLEAYLREVVGRYKDKVDAWDVVNEVIDESQPNGMRDSRWYQLTGLDFIRTAFRVTREVDPDGKLYINDYSTHNPRKRDFLFDLVQQLRAEGVPIDGVGHQTHINISNPSIALISESIRKFGEVGLDNQITELDISVYSNNSDAHEVVPQELLLKQGYRYKELFEELKRLDEEGNYISNVTLWGIADDHSWLHNRPITRQDAPFPFDKQFQAKPAYWGMADPSQLPITAKLAESPYGQPIVDGKADIVWSTVPSLQTETKGGLMATFKTLWDENHAYIWAKVDDSTISAQDKVEIFAGRRDSYIQAQFARTGGHSLNGESKVVTEVDGGYIVEVAVPLQTAALLGDQLEFDIRVTDADTSGVTSWSDMRNAQHSDRAGLGVMTLVHATLADKAVKGSPTIDGEKDAIWTDAQQLTTGRFAQGLSGATAKFWTMWDENHLYVYAEVSDPLLSDASANAWEEDSIEIFVDQNNGKTTFYQSDDGQYRVNFNNVQSYGGNASSETFETVTKIVDGGYIVEAAIKLGFITPAIDTIIGFDLQVNNDQDGNGSRDSVAIWSDTTGQSYTNTSKLGVLRLVEDVEAPPANDQAPTSGSNPRSNPGPAAVGGMINIAVQNQNGRAIVNVPSNVLELALQQVQPNADGVKRITVEIAPQAGADAYELLLPAAGLNGELPFVLSVQTPLGIIDIPSSMLSDIDVSAQQVAIRIEAANLEHIDTELRSRIGNRPAINLNVLAAGEVIEWNHPNAAVAVSIPYEPTTEELANPDHIIIWYVDGNGDTKPVPNARWDAQTQSVTFRTTHFSSFTVVSVFKTFDDLQSYDWAKAAIETMASRGVIQGSSDSEFAPSGTIKRADFLLLLVRALELQSEGGTAFSDVSQADYYYDAVRIAKQLGITQGTGGDRFSPTAPITRQEMMVLTVHALEAAGHGIEAQGTLDDFSDAPEVAAYALESAAALISAGIVNGINGQIEPGGQLTRAQASVILHRVWKLRV
ncbi:endo-1,4-beta-xylanase [Paenibacillus abyssi]|uniref:Beta-xylanase n=1 Tax=Paenibacillus abyssi TaxID=1340531 RepID=A0A917G4P6_9BACL|nr:endo-1,4-beta-xylanase [Paenibacillus abyssi]GGG22704.1 hypothetical protein GCM10010916_44210 [Paenibacillus abyssi]